MVQPDVYSVMIVSKYFSTVEDFKRLVFVCRKMKEIPLMFHFNPVQVDHKTQRIFPNMETIYLYFPLNEEEEGSDEKLDTIDDKYKTLELYNKVVVWYEIDCGTYEKFKSPKIEFKRITYSLNDNWTKGVEFPDYVNRIGDLSLRELIIEKDIVFPDKITSLGNAIFHHSEGPRHVKISKNVRELPGTFYMADYLEEVDLSMITTIGEDGLYGCNHMTSLTLSSDLETIGENALNHCDKLKEINCDGLREVNDPIPLFVAKMLRKKGVRVKKTTYTERDYLENKLDFPEDLYSIEHLCFVYQEMNDLIIPTTVRIIQKNSLPPGLTRLVIPSTVEIMSNQIINGENLEELEFYEETIFDGNPFGDISGVTKLTFNNKVCKHRVGVTTAVKMKEFGIDAINCTMTNSDEMEDGVIPPEVRIIANNMYWSFFDDNITVVIPSTVREIEKGALDESIQYVFENQNHSFLDN
ncbi:hypothetical protein EIN_006050 [Entamoeba invadens IP1]|uniref:Leucine rich repeat containing protein BspA family protein n=1 Tax=Entamoeba invadens IP1 TaxID=370355 RepID=A0A0A1UCM4_ENTIV|nr:hypothetical protein EIN_006050 [Entamoeba invadens IP1]ELP93674.1 hypothetical protein EIN_006050 [Entamoeba invadens IP1]|eukprot:XP_004260445.1 hypothetical protein EIN_006050 [Entamoeba invadens IP1]